MAEPELPPPRAMSPPLLVMAEPELSTTAPVALASKSLLSLTFSLSEVDVMVLPAASVMLPWALSVKLAAPPAVLAMLSLTLMSPAPPPPAPVAMVTLVPASRLAAMSAAKMTDSASLLKSLA